MMWLNPPQTPFPKHPNPYPAHAQLIQHFFIVSGSSRDGIEISKARRGIVSQ